jgi:hypothetical protein
MSGNTSSPHGIQDRRIQAAREWLNRAEAQFASGQDVLAASTLMLAQAELKLAVEKIAGTKATAPVVAGQKKFRLQPIGRSLIGAVALAACFLFGIYIGNVNAPNANIGVPDEGPAAIVQIADAQPVVEAPIVELEDIIPVEESPEMTAIEGASISEETAVPEEEQPVYAPPASRPNYRPHTVRTPPPEPAPVSMEPPAPSEINPLPEAGEPVEVSYEPPPVVPGVDAVSSEGEVSEAEVALATIRFLSERLLEDTE